MKKLVMGSALVLVMALNVKAQHVSFGPTFGFGHTSNSYDVPNGDKKFYPLYNAGLSLIYSTNTNWGFGADVKYAAEGARYKGSAPVNGGTVNGEVKSRINYLRVPLKAMYFFGEYGNAVRPKIYAGPSFGFLLGGESESFVNGISQGTTKAKDNVEGFDFGVQGGIGANFRLAPSTWLNTDISYYHGVKDITKANDTEGRNFNVGINVGLMFGIGGK